MSAITDAWADLLAAYQENVGASPVIACGGVSNVPCIFGTDSADFSFVGGGIASSGQNTIQTLYSAWSGDIPQKGEIATITSLPNSRTVAQQVISTEYRDGILYITIGDNSAS